MNLNSFVVDLNQFVVDLNQFVVDLNPGRFTYNFFAIMGLNSGLIQ